MVKDGSWKSPTIFQLWLLIFLYPSMPDLSDVGPPTKGPGLPYRVPEAPPPPVRVKIEHG